MLVMSRDYRPFLDDIRRSCEKVIRYTDGMTFEQSRSSAANASHTILSGMIAPLVPSLLVLADLPAGVEIVVPAGLRIGDAIPLPEQVQGRWITIGSGPDQDIILRDQPAGIGRSHGRMILRDGVFRFQGRLHPAGWALNGERFYDCTARPLHDGDLVTIGEHATFRFSLSSTGER
jgi:hypothetical protein